MIRSNVPGNHFVLVRFGDYEVAYGYWSGAGYYESIQGIRTSHHEAGKAFTFGEILERAKQTKEFFNSLKESR